MSAPILRAGTPEEAGFDPDALDRIRMRAAAWVREGLTPALVLIAARHGVVALHEAYGQLTPKSDGQDLSVDSIFPASSLCKPLTATALFMLVEEGLVNLHVPARNYLPELAGHGVEDVTAAHLLTHTSGFVDADVTAFRIEHRNERAAAPALDATEHRTIRRSLDATYGCPLSRPPGELMSYCNHGYELIGEIVRRVSGQSLWQFIGRRIFEPLSMRDSSLRLEPEFAGRVVKRELRWGGPNAMLIDDDILDTPWAGSGLNTTAMDIARLGQAALNGGRYGDVRLLSAASVREMTKNQVPDGVAEMSFRGSAVQGSYGYGWFVQGDHRWPMNGSLLPEGTFSHTGLGGTSVWIDPLNDLVGAFFSVSTWESESVLPESPYDLKLGAAPFQDMVAAAVAD